MNFSLQEINEIIALCDEMVKYASKNGTISSGNEVYIKYAHSINNFMYAHKLKDRNYPIFCILDHYYTSNRGSTLNMREVKTIYETVVALKHDLFPESFEKIFMVQLPEVCDEKSEAAKNGYPNICEIGKERIRRAGQKLIETGKDIDTGFKVFRLDSSNLKLWDDTPIESGDLDSLFARMNGIIDNLKPGRSEDDLAYEILLKMGYPLTADVAALEVDGLTVYTVEQNSMLICLQPGVTAETVEKLAVLGPKKIVLIENALADNSAMSNAHYLLENRGIELKIV